METFSALLAFCVGNSPVPGEFPAQRLVTQSFDVSFNLRLKTRLCKQSWGWWFETPACPFWRHRNVLSLNENVGIWLIFHSIVFPRVQLTIRQHWYRFGTKPLPEPMMTKPLTPSCQINLTKIIITHLYIKKRTSFNIFQLWLLHIYVFTPRGFKQLWFTATSHIFWKERVRISIETSLKFVP